MLSLDAKHGLSCRLGALTEQAGLSPGAGGPRCEEASKGISGEQYEAQWHHRQPWPMHPPPKREEACSVIRW
jgi:hypothetical protein